jgi:uncharacterized damage-inducible protein DinB
MTAETLPRPGAGEYNEYYQRYIAMVPEGDIVETLRREMVETQAVLASVPADRETYRYAHGKWSIREVVGHLIDTERLFAFRALWFARGEGSEMGGMDQDAWVLNSNAADRPLSELADEWAALRRANVHMFGSFDAATGALGGVASGFDVTVRALVWMLAGHELHHRMLIRRDYLGGRI